jgi:ABC-2 type transport system ATP-binding protein
VSSAAVEPAATAAPRDDLVVVTHHLGRTFGSIVAVRDVSLSVHKGEIFGILGPNGAGKSTTIRMLCGILDPTSGGGEVVGFDIATQAERIKERIGYMTQRFSLYEDLSVEENLSFYAGIYGVERKKLKQRIERALDLLDLGARRRQLAGTLSGGWKQRVALASATIHDPPLLFLDEPTAGVDPVSRREFWERIHRLASDGTTTIVTTHYMDEAERCHRLAFIFRGALLDVGTPEEVVARRNLSAAELEIDRAREAAGVLRAVPAIDEVSHFANRLRVTAVAADALDLCRQNLEPRGFAIRAAKRERATVEDAFVSMVRRGDDAPTEARAD